MRMSRSSLVRTALFVFIRVLSDVNILTDLAAAYLSDLQFHKAREYAETAMRIDPNSDVTREVLSNIDRFQRNLRRFG